MTSLILSLDDPGCLDPAKAGAKAAWLARARQAGLPVLDGIVVSADESEEAMAFGVEMMQRRGSGGARVAMSTRQLRDELSKAIAQAIPPLGEPLVVRSSTIVEGGGEWSGAFTSYLEVNRSEVDTAVRGCWASAFTVHTLERYEAAGLAPGSVPMAVLVQPALVPEFGGTARIEPTGDVIVVGVAGSPAPLVQGWEPGAHARVTERGKVSGQEAVELMGAPLLTRVAELLRAARSEVGATTCEWAVAEGEVIFFQLMASVETSAADLPVPPGLDTDQAASLARIVRRAPGPLGEALVLPWAIARPDRFLEGVDPVDLDPLEAFHILTEHSRSLTAETWGLPKPAALARALEVLRGLRSTDPAPALAAVSALRSPDPERGRLVLGLLARVRIGLADAGAVSHPDVAWHIPPERVGAILGGGSGDQLMTRIGFDRWEPFDVGVVMTHGRVATGIPAAPGMASGRLCFIADPSDTAHFRPRDVVVGIHPIPNLAALLWDAAALVTTGGGPGAHLFESTRALAIPAVCAVHLDEALGDTVASSSGRAAMAVDGTTGRVAVTEW